MNVIDKKATELAYDMIEEGHPREEILEELTNYYEFHDQLKIELEKLKIPKNKRNKWYSKIERAVQGLLIESQSLPQSEGVPSAIDGNSFLKFWGQYAQHYLSASRIDVCLKRLPTLYDLVLYGKYQRLTIRGINSIDSRYILWLHVDNRNLVKRRPFQLTHNTALDKSKGMDFLDNLVKTGQFDDVLFSTGTISIDTESDPAIKDFVDYLQLTEKEELLRELLKEFRSECPKYHYQFMLKSLYERKIIMLDLVHGSGNSKLYKALCKEFGKENIGAYNTIFKDKSTSEHSESYVAILNRVDVILDRINIKTAKS
jgi:hypothetical protein